MTEEEQIEWRRFQSFAIAQLDSAYNRQNFIALSIDPSFQKAERLYVSKTDKGLRWTYLTWDSPTDYQRIYSTHEERMKMKFGKQVPTIHTSNGYAGPDAYQKTNTIIGSLKLKSVVESDSFGLDGTTYTIAMGDYMRETKYSWWEQLPKEWTELEAIFQELKANLELARMKENT